MLYLDAERVWLHILDLQKLRVRLVGYDGKLLCVDQKINALDDL